MSILLRSPSGIELPPQEEADFQFFLQLMLNRRVVGYLRYGPTNRRQKYLTRLKKELKVYSKTGNAEQLINIAVYCFLEWHAPENKRFHFDNTVDSVTR